MVPMWMGDEQVDRIGEARAQQLLAKLADAGAAVQDNQRAVCQADLDAGGVATVPNRRGARRRYRSSDTVEGHAHGILTASCDGASMIIVDGSRITSSLRQPGWQRRSASAGHQVDRRFSDESWREWVSICATSAGSAAKSWIPAACFADAGATHLTRTWR